MVRWTVVPVIFCGLLLCGCASTAVAPVEKITTVEKAIQEARDSNATVSAPLGLRHAEDKLKEAKAAMKEEEFEKARRLADEALIDANLAEATSRSVKAKKTTQEMRDDIDTLRHEIERTEKIK
ncbi:MAG: DUF4398 domain-containing protein [Nitrospirota bacterium]